MPFTDMLVLLEPQTTSPLIHISVPRGSPIACLRGTGACTRTGSSAQKSLVVEGPPANDGFVHLVKRSCEIGPFEVDITEGFVYNYCNGCGGFLKPNKKAGVVGLPRCVARSRPARVFL